MRIYSYIVFLLVSALAVAQEKNTPASSPWPAVSLFPWLPLNVDADLIARARPALAAGFKELAATMIDNAVSLDKYLENNAGGRTILLNTKAEAKKFIVGNSKLPNTPQPLAIQPIICPMYDRIMLALVAQTSQQQLFLTLSSTTLTKQNWLEAQRRQDLESLISTTATTLVTRLKAKLPQKTLSLSPVKVRLGLAEEKSRFDETSNHCLNLLFADSLSEEIKLISSVGNENLGFLQRALAAKPQMSRSNRHLLTLWQASQSQNDRAAFPKPLQLNAFKSEAVFARTIDPKITEQVDLILNGNQFSIAASKKVLDFIRQESVALKASDLPQVALVYGAWVYLDKGRAWGLDMNDRLIADKDGEKILGHVVGFFGPTLNLRSPRGYPIHEGAIVYIRKGQKLTEKGLSFNFDPKNFPTPWPPQTSN